MNVQKNVEKITQDKNYTTWKTTHQESFLAHIAIIDSEGKIGY